MKLEKAIVAPAEGEGEKKQLPEKPDPLLLENFKNKILRIFLHDKIDDEQYETLLDEVKTFEEKLFLTTLQNNGDKHASKTVRFDESRRESKLDKLFS